MNSTYFGSRSITPLMLGLIVAVSRLPAAADEPLASGWRYVLPPLGANQELPPARAVKLSGTKPDDLKEPAAYRGRERRYGQIVFGSPTSVPVAIMVDQVSDNEVDFYLDANRNRAIEAKERRTVSLSFQGGSEPVQVALDVAVVENQVTTSVPRAVVIWIGRGGKSLRYAAAGYLEGTVAIDGRDVLARRVDADGDGFVTGPADLLWLDLDGDGRWDPISERFAPTPVLRLGTNRYALRADESGAAVTLTKIEGTGSVECSTASLKLPQFVREIAVSLVGRDGSAATLTSVGTALPVPVGEYRLYLATLVLEDPAGGDPWYFRFEPPTRQSLTAWHAVEADGKLTIDPFTGPTLEGLLDNPPPSRVKPDQTLTVQTRLTTRDGLALLACCRSRTWDNQHQAQTEVLLTSSAGDTLASAKIGFS